MKELIRDLATHYNLSERQVKFMSDSCVFDSFSKAEIESKVCLKKLRPLNNLGNFYRWQKCWQRLGPKMMS